MAVRAEEALKGGEGGHGVLPDDAIAVAGGDDVIDGDSCNEKLPTEGHVVMAALRPGTVVQREEQASRRMESGEREASQRRLPPGYIRPDPGLVRRIHNNQELRQRVVSQIQALVFAMPVGDIGEEDSGFVKQLLEGLQKALRGEELPPGKVAAVVTSAVRGARVTMTIGELYAAAPGLQALIDDAIRAVLPKRDAEAAVGDGREVVLAAASSTVVPTVVPESSPAVAEAEHVGGVEKPVGGVLPLPA
jgi:hypothetical protein